MVGLTPPARFAINTVLIPEHVSTVLISVVVGALLSASGRLPALPRDDFHVVCSGIAYGAVASFLLALTLRNRWKFPAITLDPDGFSTSALGITTGASLWGRVDSVEIRAGRFFGRASQVLCVKTGSAVVLEAPDSYFDWEALVESAKAASRRTISRHSSLTESEATRLTFIAMARDAMFGPRESILMFLVRLPIRALYMLPVVAMDVAAGLWLTSVLGSDKPIVAWAAPLSLAASAVVARWVSYNLSTSLALRPLFFPTDPARLAQVRKLEAESRRAR